MCPTIVDSLVVELGLDPSNFSAKSRTAIDDLKKLEQAGDKRSKAIQEGAKKESESLRALTGTALELFAVFTGATGIKDFVVNTIQVGASVGRLSRAIGVSASEISKWQGVAREFGSTGENMAGAFKSLSDVFTAWQVGGPEAPGIMQIFRVINTEAERLDKNNAKTIDGTKGVNAALLATADNLKIIHDLAGDKNLADYLAGKIPGMDAGLFDAMSQGGDKLAETLKKVTGWTDAEAEAATKLQRRWEALKVSAENLGLRALFGVIDAMHTYSGAPTTGSEPVVNSQKISEMSSSGGFTSQAQKEAFIRTEAAKRGINPDAAMAVARSEGFNTFASSIPGETSYGAFQLNVTPGGRGGSQGDLFRKATGLDPADPKNEPAGIQWALEDIRRTGWQHYHGAANGAHFSNWQGIDRGGGGSGSTTVEINGPVTVTGVRDPVDFTNKLRDLGLKRQAEANQSSVGGQ